MTLHFWKMSGAGNDFVCLDNRKKKLRLNHRQISHLCHRQFGVGADGLLVLEPSAAKGTDFRMRYYNADGSEAEMCGNGARCFARFAQARTNWKKPVMSFTTPAGLITAEFIRDEVRINMTQPQSYEAPRALKIQGRKLNVHFINTGVPHAVIFVDDIESFDVRGFGREIRFHKAFAPKGANVNFVKVVGRGHIRVRTYERGVEDETLACGTGVVAAVLISHLEHGFKAPVRVRVQSGRLLAVGFTREGGAFRNVTLLGPAETTFEGDIDV
jgi:diaminopimelate epimerase